MYKDSIQEATKWLRVDLPQKLYLLRHGLIDDNKIFTHLSIDEKISIHRILSTHKEKLICVEIGSFLGASACFICNAISQKSRLYCIDTWGNHAMKHSEEDDDIVDERNTYPEFINNTQKYRSKIVQLRGWSDKVFDELQSTEQYIDFLFIDGDHSYESVKKDWDLYSSLLKPGAIVAFHDTGWAEGVNRVIQESVNHNAQQIAKLPNLEFYQIQSK
ncbi:MAG: class I SAM-dependent methyltransferase [Stigonema ocellatum SAG 48.90 = DSM 106950]|nr:class I SAM-dependent methyltransferase [Stigonema ocellatum SAG 48.90 = DSM 106950]